jgi:TetR/AcrR family transcriptional regulator, transcriptional repressor of bet genes
MGSGQDIMASHTTRAEQKQQTKKRILRAIAQIIAREGFTGVTMARVAELTGLSRGMCNYHFETKEQVMIDVLKMIYDEHEAIWKAVVDDATKSPVEKISTLVEVLLSKPFATEETLSVWQAYWGVPQYRQLYLEICTAGDRAYEDSIEELLSLLANGRNEIKGIPIKELAVAFTGIIDGMHTEYLIAPGRLSRNNAIKVCYAYLSSFFPEFEPFVDG